MDQNNPRRKQHLHRLMRVTVLCCTLVTFCKRTSIPQHSGSTRTTSRGCSRCRVEINSRGWDATPYGRGVYLHNNPLLNHSDSEPLEPREYVNGRPVFDDDTDQNEPASQEDNLSEISTLTNSSRDWDPDARGPPIKTPNMELQHHLESWVQQLEAINATRDDMTFYNSTRWDLCWKFVNSIAPEDIEKKVDMEEMTEMVCKSNAKVDYLLKSIRRCATGRGVKQLIDTHFNYAGFEFWEHVVKSGDFKPSTSRDARYEMHFAYHKGRWRFPSISDRMKEGWLKPNGEVMFKPGHILYSTRENGLGDPVSIDSDYEMYPKPKHVPQELWDKHKHRLEDSGPEHFPPSPSYSSADCSDMDVPNYYTL